MRIAYFSDCLLPAQQQASYDELLASQEPAAERAQPAPKAKPRRLSTREMTRDLAGWTIPQAGALRASSY